MKKVNLESDYEEITRQINRARNWALKHFNAKDCYNDKIINEDLTLVKPSFFVEFPTLDTMIVWPSCIGQKSVISFEYKLAFNPLEWHGKHPFWRTPMPPLKVKELE